MKGGTAISIFGLFATLASLSGAIAVSCQTYKVGQEWPYPGSRQPKTMLFSKQTQSHNMEKKFDVGDFVRYTAYSGAKPEYGFVKQVRLDKDGLKVWVVGVRDANRDVEWKHKTGALTPIDKLEKVD